MTVPIELDEVTRKLNPQWWRTTSRYIATVQQDWEVQPKVRFPFKESELLSLSRGEIN